MSNTESTSSLMEIIRRLIGDPQEYAEFKENPTQYVIDHGLEDASYEEITEAVTIAFDMPVVSQGAVVNGGNATATIGTTAPAGPGPAAPAAPAPAAAAPAPLVLPPPPPVPPASMPPAQAVEQVINHYVTHVYETTNVDDRDTYADNSVTNNVHAEDGAHVDIDNDIDAVTVSGDGAVGAGEDSELNGIATGDGAVAAGDDVGVANTGYNSGVVGEEIDVDDSIFGDNNTQVNDNYGTATVGDGNVVATDGSQAAGRDLTDNDITVENSTLEGSNVGGVGNTAVQDNDTYTQDNDTAISVVEVDQNVDQSINDSFNTTGGEGYGEGHQGGYEPGEVGYENGYEESTYDGGYEEQPMMEEPAAPQPVYAEVMPEATPSIDIDVDGIDEGM
jgi:hypothetical protein